MTPETLRERRRRREQVRAAAEHHEATIKAQLKAQADRMKQQTREAEMQVHLLGTWLACMAPVAVARAQIEQQKRKGALVPMPVQPTRWQRLQAWALRMALKVLP